MNLPPSRLALLSLGAMATGILLCVLALVWLTPITGLVCFFIGTPCLLAGLVGYAVGVLRDLSSGAPPG